jgi:hypothetical protein
MGTEIPVPGIKGRDCPRGTKLHSGILFPKQVPGSGTQCPERSRSSSGESAAEDIDQSSARDCEREDGITGIYPVSLFTAEPYWGNHFWAKGYCVDTVGIDADMIRKYVKYQEKQEQKQIQMNLNR